MATACATSPTGRRQLMLLPDSQMNQMGEQAFTEMKRKQPIENDAASNRYVRCITDPLVQVVAERGGPAASSWEVVVFKDDTANAFALPGGKIGVHTGLLKLAKNDAQVAAVLGHEVGHVLARHGDERASQSVLVQGGLIGAGALAGDSDQSRILLAALGLGAQFGILMPYGRAQESEADVMGLEIMADAGFDPGQSVELWKNMEAAGGGGPPEFLSTHPSHGTRIQNLTARQPEARTRWQAAQGRGKRPACKL